jgi:hypothetical protein
MHATRGGEVVLISSNPERLCYARLLAFIDLHFEKCMYFLQSTEK